MKTDSWRATEIIKDKKVNRHMDGYGDNPENTMTTETWTATAISQNKQ